MTKQETSTTTSECRGFFGWSGKFFIFLLTGGALAASVMSLLSCKFFEFDIPDDGQDGGNENDNHPIFIPDDAETGHIGLFSYAFDDDSQCSGYKHQFFKSEFNRLVLIAKFCSIGAPAVGALAWTLNLYFCLRTSTILQVPITFILLTVACLGQLGTFLIYAQDDFCFGDGSFNCSLGFGGILSIMAVSGFFLSSVVVCCMPKGKKQEKSDNDGGSCWRKKKSESSDDNKEDLMSLDEMLGTSEKKRNQSLMETSRTSDEWTFADRNMWDAPTVNPDIEPPEIKVNDYTDENLV